MEGRGAGLEQRLGRGALNKKKKGGGGGGGGGRRGGYQKREGLTLTIS